MKRRVYIGTSGYNYKHWKGVFYPKDLPQEKWLEYYARHFKTVEINATFYGNFKKEVFEKWGNQVSDKFYFCLKGPRFITHVKRLKKVESSIELFLKNAGGLGSKLKIILWQFPGSFKFNSENFGRLEHFSLILPKNIGHAFEFRDQSWFNDQVCRLLNKYHCGFVISDSPLFPKAEISTGGFSYIRFHGSLVLYSSSYSTKELEVWSEKIKKFQKSGDVYCYFNNDVLGFAVGNAKELTKLLR